MSHDPEMEMLCEVFEKVGAAATADLGISVREQRVDCTLITSSVWKGQCLLGTHDKREEPIGTTADARGTEIRSARLTG